MCPNESSFVKYCKEKLNNSLITGIGKIANTKNSRRKAFKWIVFFMSIGGFLWQTHSFLEIYLDYPVIQHMKTEDPEVISAPAVTLCNRNRLKRSLFCKYVPNRCLFFGFNARDFICRTDKKLCPNMKPENGKVGFPRNMLTYGEPLYNQSHEFLETIGPQSQWDLLEECTIEKIAQSKTCNESNVIHVPYEGVPYTCFAFFSLIDEPNKDPENLSLSDYYSFRLNMHPEEDFGTAQRDGVYISVHDPRTLKNPVAEMMVLQSGYSYRLYVTMQQRENLPPPYETKCTDYLALWKENGGRGPLSKTDCMQFCMMDDMLENLGCLTQAIVYPNNLTFCPHKAYRRVSEELVTKCESSCYEGCEVTEYSIASYEIIDNIKDKLCNESSDYSYHCRASYLDIEIKFNRLRVERLNAESVFVSEELFSHIGGYMGLWLGITIITLFDLIETLVDIIVYPMMKWKKRKTKIASCAEDKRNV